MEGNPKDLTIIFPIKDRAPFTVRFLSYADKIRFPYKIFIADGGEDKTIQKYLLDKNHFHNIDYEYVRYPYDSTYTEYYSKMADSLLKIQTPFVAMADNDDFCMVEGLRKSVEFLKDNPDYAVCRGAIGGFTVDSTDKNGKYAAVIGKLNMVSKNLYYNGSNEHESAAERVKCHFSRYGSTCYDVHRTEQLGKYYSILRNLDPKNIYLAELVTSFLAVAEGKAKRFPYPYYMRQCNTPETCNRSESQKYDFFDRMLLPSWSDDFTGFAGAVASAVAEKDNIPIEDALYLVKGSYKKYVSYNIVWSLTRDQKISQAEQLFQKIGRKLRSIFQINIIDRFRKDPGRDIEPIYRYFNDELPSSLSDYIKADSGK